MRALQNYENLGRIGEGTYGVVLKCRNRETGHLVAIKKFKDSDEDEQVRETALREVRLLKQLKHENIVSLTEVFRRKGKLYLVFEYVERTILEDLEKHMDGLSVEETKKVMWQLLRSIAYCHNRKVLHRDIKPENLLISKEGVLKLCDFGFARPQGAPSAKYSDYVATRWYRAPELLVGDQQYGTGVDTWAIGCMFVEVATGQPLFPGESDVDQLWLIMKCLGRLCPKHVDCMRRNPMLVGLRMPGPHELETLETRFPQFDLTMLQFLKACLHADPEQRPSCEELMKYSFFHGVEELFGADFRKAIAKDRERCRAEEERVLVTKRRKLQKMKADRIESGVASGPSGSYLGLPPKHERGGLAHDHSENSITTVISASILDQLPDLRSQTPHQRPSVSRHGALPALSEQEANSRKAMPLRNARRGIDHAGNGLERGGGLGNADIGNMGLGVVGSNKPSNTMEADILVIDKSADHSMPTSNSTLTSRNKGGHGLGGLGSKRETNLGLRRNFHPIPEGLPSYNSRHHHDQYHHPKPTFPTLNGRGGGNAHGDRDDRDSFAAPRHEHGHRERIAPRFGLYSDEIGQQFGGAHRGHHGPKAPRGYGFFKGGPHGGEEGGHNLPSVHGGNGGDHRGEGGGFPSRGSGFDPFPASTKPRTPYHNVGSFRSRSPFVEGANSRPMTRESRPPTRDRADMMLDMRPTHTSHGDLENHNGSHDHGLGQRGRTKGQGNWRPPQKTGRRYYQS